MLPVVLAACIAGDEEPVPTSESCEVAPLYAYHYGWYGTPAGSGAWRHWDDASHDPETLADDGRPNIAAAHDPEVGPYDSLDTDTLRRQIDEAIEAGLDGFVVSWWGEDSFEDDSIAALADEIERNGDAFGFAVYYEQVPESDPQRAIEEIAYLDATFFGRTSYLRHGGDPLLLLYGRAVFPGLYCLFEGCPDDVPDTIDWGPILEEAGGGLSVWADVVSNAMFPDNVGIAAGMGFDGVHVYNPHVEVMAGVDMEEFQVTLVDDAHGSGMLAAATVIPGYDDTALDRPGTTAIPREDGQLYDQQWNAAVSASPDLYLLTSYNEWHEGTEIEPSFEDGDAYLQATAEWSAARPCTMR